MTVSRVKYYSSNDMTCGANLLCAAEVIEKYCSNNSHMTVNDILELYNIQKFFENNVVLTVWSSDRKTRYATLTKQFSEPIGRYIGNLCNRNIFFVLKHMDLEYREDFWTLFSKYKAYKKISAATFKKLLQSKHIFLSDILKNQELVIIYDKELREELMSDAEYATLLVRNYLEGYDRVWIPLLFPKSLSTKDAETLILQYIESKEANLNMLELISKAQNSVDLPLSPKTILAAKKRCEKEVEVFLRNQQPPDLSLVLK